MLNLNFLPSHFTLFLVLGIVLGYYFEFTIGILIAAVIITVLGLIYFNYRANSTFKQSGIFAIFTAIGFLFIGIINIQIQNPKSQKTHYINNYTSNKQIVIKIRSILKPSKIYQKYEGQVILIGSIKTKGSILLNIIKQNLEDSLKVDDVILTYNSLQEINKALNPNEFDYRAFLKKKGVYRQIRLKKRDFILLRKGRNSLKGYAYYLRSKINKALKTFNFSASELAIINAIILGQRQDISPDLFESYKNAGAIHILAVSGLHIGIILLLLNLLFKPLEKLKNGKYIKLLLVIFCLWIYAFIAGMSASVIRAVTMFTAITIGWMSNRPSNVKNSLIVSFFFLLLIHPLFLFDVGFQLSYTAVFSIVLIQPLIIKIWKPKWKFAKYFWQLLTVSLAAQLGILPLSLYYFHQFPGLFFLSSLVIIPFLGIIIGFGILVILLALTQILPQFFADIYGFFISSMNNFVNFISLQETFVFHDIYFSLILLITFYLFLVFSIHFSIKQTSQKLIIVLVTIVVIQVSFIYEKLHDQKLHELIIFHQTKNSILAIKKQKVISLHHSIGSMETYSNKIINSYLLGMFLQKKVISDTLKNVYRLNHEYLYFVDSLGIYKSLKFSPKIVVLTRSPKINLNRLIQVLHPKVIIADGSNYKNYTQRWEKTCKNKKVIFHNTSKKGAFVAALDP